MKKTHIIIGALGIILVLAIALGEFFAVPYISGKEKLSETQIEAIEGQARGWYSDILPLIPVFVSADRVEGETVYYTIYYSPFGTAGMSYIQGDGYNMEKPLTGL